MSRIDLSFADRYDREMAKFGSLRSSSEKRINEDVMKALEDTVNAQSEVLAVGEYAEQVPALNDQILEREGFTRREMEEGRLPAYMSDMVHDESVVGVDYDKQADDLQESLFAAVYRVDPILSADTRASLGPEYQAYVKDRDRQISQQLEADRAAARRQNGARSTFFDRQTGESYLSLVDESGRDTQDPYAFDEYD